MLNSRLLKSADLILLATTILLVATGVMIIYAGTLKAAGVTSAVDVRNQIIFAVIGFGALVLGVVTDYRVWAKYTTPLYFLTLILLLGVLATHPVLGASRWINLGFFQFQPSELAKLVMVIVLAKFFATNYERMDQPKYLLLSVAYLALPVALVMAQPDLGTALVLIVIWLAMAIVGRVRKLHMAGMALVAIALAPLAVHFLKPYQRDRLATFLNPMADPLGRGYNVVQSTIAVGSGKLFGRGLAAGSQSELNFLPSQHTDFIFAVLAEKLGFIGALLLLVLFSILIMRGMMVAWRAQDRFGFFLAVGIIAMFLFHIFINIGMNLGIMPVTGIPLPFISYGGTSLLMALFAVGLLESIAVRRKKIQF